MTALAAVALNGCIGNIFIIKDKLLSTVSIASLLMMVILPLGSDNAIYNAGTPVLWIGAAAGIAFAQSKAGKAVAIATTLLLTASTATKVLDEGFYFDNTTPMEMKAEIPSEKARGLLTSPARAGRTGAILRAVAPHVSPGDTLLVYGSAPMINHLTSTVPAIGCSWPELLTPALLDAKLNASPAPENVMIIKFNTLGSSWGKASKEYMYGLGKETNRFHNAAKSEIILKFLEKKEYRTVTETPDFVLYQRN